MSRIEKFWYLSFIVSLPVSRNQMDLTNGFHHVTRLVKVAGMGVKTSLGKRVGFGDFFPGNGFSKTVGRFASLFPLCSCMLVRWPHADTDMREIIHSVYRLGDMPGWARNLSEVRGGGISIHIFFNYLVPKLLIHFGKINNIPIYSFG